MYMDIYAIQNVPPSNINRDETGNPKTALYGGFLRSRFQPSLETVYATHIL